MSIEDIIANSRCPFAKLAKLTSPIIIDSMDIYKEIHKHRHIIVDFFIDNDISKYDALCFAFTDPSFGESIDKLSKNTNLFFKALQKEFGSFEVPQQIFDYNEISWPSIENERFFMISFANCYPPESPRFNHNDKTTYFLLQPVSSFVRHAKNGNSITDAMREKIRNLFIANKQPYDGNISCLKNEFVKMVAPLNLGDHIVEWWKL